MDPIVFPQFSILDPSTTYSLQNNQTVNGIVDAFVHVMEQYLTSYTNAQLIDRIAEGILLTLIEEGPKILQSPHDYELRANIMWCAIFGGIITKFAANQKNSKTQKIATVCR